MLRATLFVLITMLLVHSGCKHDRLFVLELNAEEYSGYNLDTLRYYFLGSSGKIDSFRIISQYCIYADEAPEFVNADTTIMNTFYPQDGSTNQETLVSTKLNSRWYNNISTLQVRTGLFILEDTADGRINMVNNFVKYNYLSKYARDTMHFRPLFVSTDHKNENYYMFYTGIDSVIRVDAYTRTVGIYIGSPVLSDLRNYPSSLSNPQRYVERLFIDKELHIPLRIESHTTADLGNSKIIYSQASKLKFVSRKEYASEYARLMIDTLPKQFDSTGASEIKLYIRQ